MQLPFITNALFWASGDNLGLKLPTNSFKRVADPTLVSELPLQLGSRRIHRAVEQMDQSSQN